MFSPPYSENIQFADSVYLHGPYLPAYVTCPFFDSWRQYCLSFFEGFSTFCTTAQQPLIICHIYSSSSQASFDDKPERIKSSNISVHIRSIVASLWAGCDCKTEGINKEIKGHKCFPLRSYFRQKAADKYLAIILFFFFPKPSSPYQLWESILFAFLSARIFKNKKCGSIKNL